MNDLSTTIADYIEQQFLIEWGGGPNQVTPDTDLFEQQIVDSFGFVELVGFLEKQFDIKITDDDLLSNRLTTLNKTVALVQERIRG